jgi:formylglycine-generating enzyme required for sulfatase activity
VLPFTGVSTVDGENIALLLANDREIQAAFTVVPRTITINNLVTGQFQRSGLTDSDTISAIGHELEADFVITAHIRKLGDRNLVIISIVEVDTYQQISGGYREFSNLSELRNILPDIAKRMVDATRIDSSQMPGLAVFPFVSSESTVSAEDAEVLTQLLSIEIANTGRFVVLPRTKTIATALEGNEARVGALSDVNSLKAIGKAINAQYVLAANAMSLGAELNLFLAQILNINTLAMLTGSDVEYRTITDGLHLMPELSFQLTGVRSETADYTGPTNMVWIAGGTFRMGSISGEADEEPVHTVQVNGFFIGRAEVTQKEYLDILGTNPSFLKGNTLPVVNITWFDAIEYCNKLSLKQGLTPAYSGSNENIVCNFTANGYRLPTEAEWEYAARGGNRDTLRFPYAGGNTVGLLGWYADNSGREPHDVESKSPNSLGLYDMSGNVWEWCWDWYGPYSGDSATNPLGEPAGTWRVTRGGSWNTSADQLRSTYRSYSAPSMRYYDLGFRIIRPIF